MAKVVFRTLVICFILVISVHSAEAGKRSFGIDPFTAFTNDVADYSYAGGVVMREDPATYFTNPEFTIRFMMPDGYRKNGSAKITFYYMPFLGTENCGEYVLFDRIAGRFQPGAEGHSRDALTIKPANGSLVLGTDGQVVQLKTFNIRPEPGKSLKPRDYVFATFTRDVLDLADTCTDDLFIVGIRVTYQTR
jgi:hypothetical protein